MGGSPARHTHTHTRVQDYRVCFSLAGLNIFFVHIKQERIKAAKACGKHKWFDQLIVDGVKLLSSILDKSDVTVPTND